MEHTDVIVVGLGAFGAAAAGQLAKRGFRVVGLDRFTPPHGLGSSHGRTRLIRHANSRNADYVPLILRARELWHSLEQTANIPLVQQTGMLIVGGEDSYPIQRGMAADKAYGLGLEYLTGRDLSRRFPDVRTLSHEVGFYEPTAAVLSVEEGIESLHAEAIRHGADLRMSCGVEQWEAQDDRVIVTTPQGTITADNLVLAPGAWLGQLWNGSASDSAEAQPDFVVLRQHFAWFDAPARPDLPLLVIDRADAPPMFAFPDVDGDGLKVGVDLVVGANPVHPDRVPRTITSKDIELLTDLVAERLPWAGATIREAKTCLYEMTSDWHFALGPHPNHGRVVIAGGGSGIGFMYAPVIGEVVADLVSGADSPYELSHFDPARLIRRVA